MISRIAAIAWLAALGFVGCGEAPSTAASAGPTAIATASTTGTIAASGTSSLSATPPSSPLSGAWQGAFESKKATITLDPGVKEKAWSGDDGRAHAGKGEIDLHVGVDGVVKGKLRGSLGSATVAGTAEDQTLTMTFAPAEGDSSGSISGVIVLKLEGAKLIGDLKASSGDASIVRAARLELTRGGS